VIGFAYRKYPYFLHFLGFNLIWFTARTLQWFSYEPDRLSFILQHTAVDILVSITLCMLFTEIGNWSLHRRNLILNWTIFPIVSVIFPTIYFVLANTVKSLIGIELYADISTSTLLSFTFRNLLYVLTVDGVFFWTYYRLCFLEQRERSYRAENLAKDAQLLMFQYQIHPHFLFNILNSLYALVDEDKGLAKQLIVKLSEYYRSTLSKAEAEVTVEQELEIIRQYLDIQKIRFEEQLQVKIEVEDDALERRIPSFVLHLLVENAVKYASRGSDGQVVVTLNVQIIDEALYLTAKNPGRLNRKDKLGTDERNGTGRGLENIRERLKLYYADAARLNLAEKDGWVTAEIILNPKTD
jgi:hypothetical protein